jgi:D-alanyl-D-alanine carboxypeptidase/D-alanyl-D-alanine-endopeptidase (penicillin-binding protein 4)
VAVISLAVPSLRDRVGRSVQSMLGTSAISSIEATPPTLQLGPLPADAPTPTTGGLASALDKLADVPQLGTLSGVVVDPVTGRTLWSHTPTKALTPGSTGKLLTAAAALLTLDPSSRLTTTVVAGSTPDSVIVVGGGDPTLSVLPDGQDSVYRGAAKLDTLVRAVKAQHPGPIRTVSVDLSRWTGPTQAPGWETADIKGGYFTPIEPLMLDGGRQDKPDELDPPRSATPGIDAGKQVAKLLGADPKEVKVQTAPAGAQVLGSVSSPPITDLVQNALRISDNVLAEALARQVAVAKGGDPSFSGAVRAVLGALTSAALDVGDTRIVDGSGLSTQDEVSAKLLGQIMTAASAPTGPSTSQAGLNQTDLNQTARNDVSRTAQATESTGSAADTDRAARLRPLLGGLPVAGGDGTLDDRFIDGPSKQGRGYVRAKTGTLTGVSSLAGTVVDQDGRLLVFAWLSNGTSPADSRPRLDALAAALRGCGCR